MATAITTRELFESLTHRQQVMLLRHELKACREMLAAARAELAKADAAFERGSCQSNCCRRCDNAAKAIIADCLKWTPKGGKDDGSD